MTVMSVLKRTPMQDFNSLPIVLYYIISTTYQKIGDRFCPVHISGLLHSVNRFIFWHLVKFFGANTHIIPKWRKEISIWSTMAGLDPICPFIAKIPIFDIFNLHMPPQSGMYYLLSFPAGLFRPGKSRKGPGTGRDRTGPRDLKVPWSCGSGTKEVQKSRNFFWRSWDFF